MGMKENRKQIWTTLFQTLKDCNDFLMIIDSEYL